MSLRVDTHISGATVVVWRNSEHYLEAKEAPYYPHLVLIELVRNGQVYLRDEVGLCDAPKAIMQYVRQELI